MRDLLDTLKMENFFDANQDDICKTSKVTVSGLATFDDRIVSKYYLMTFVGTLTGLCDYAQGIVQKRTKMFQKTRLFLPTLLSHEDLDRFMYAQGSTLKSQAGLTLEAPLGLILGLYKIERSQLNWFVGTEFGSEVGDGRFNTLYGLPTEECNCDQNWGCWGAISIRTPREYIQNVGYGNSCEEGTRIDSAEECEEAAGRLDQVFGGSHKLDYAAKGCCV